MSKLIVYVLLFYVLAILRITFGASLAKENKENDVDQELSNLIEDPDKKNDNTSNGQSFLKKPVSEMTDEELMLWNLLNPSQYVLMDQRDLIIRKPSDPKVKDYAAKAIAKFNSWSPGGEVRLVRVINATGEKTGQVRERLELEVQNIKTKKIDCVFVIIFSVTGKYFDFYFEMCKYPWENAKFNIN
ncbi:unnamed protein product [Bursaphelenchus okinawaensis]|uniref:Cystatin domain-containing protein n=1 Tax=Bursaphelenchus okinawaensis TaxID=465554 RepID=A0A811LS93_9BILA|nr:unnamed protein product [Bursaphelenchus okinawaensis]CAG9127371.1 unnamed protein product [Bursaphelenchus okinawaensis]